MFHRLVPPSSSSDDEGYRMLVSATRLSAAHRVPSCLFHHPFRSTRHFFLFSLYRIYTYAHTCARVNCNVCMLGMLFSMEQMLWPLLGDPLHSARHIYISGIRRSRARVYWTPSARELGDSHFLFEFPFGLPEPRTVLSLPLCARVVVASAVLCVSTWYARVCTLACYTHVCTCERIEGRHYYPPPVPLLNFILPPCASTYGARSERNGRVACHSIAHARRQPTYTRACVRSTVCARACGSTLVPPCASNRDSH